MRRLLSMISLWFQTHMDIVFFVYGLAFVVMGILIQAQSRRASTFRIGDILWLLGAFGLIHGLNEWLDMWVIIRGSNSVMDFIRWCCLVVSYIFIFEFGRRLFITNHSASKQSHNKHSLLFKWYLTPLIVTAILILASFSDDFWITGSIWARYLPGFAGSMLTAFGFYTYYKKEKIKLAPLNVKPYFQWTFFAFFFYGIVGGIVVPTGNFFPANIINHDTFLSLINIPVQVFRAALAIIATWAVVSILRIFNWEKKRNLEVSFEKITRNYKAQDIINRILKVSLESIPFHVQLQRILNLILTIPEISLQSKGCIFLVEKDSGNLKLWAQQNFTEEQFQMCSSIPIGKCLCGLAAERNEIVFVDKVEDKRHELTYSNIYPHGHYCVPISSDNQVLGVINVYVSHDHKRDEKEEEVLTSVASTVAGIVMRKRAKNTIRENYNIQSIISAILQISLLPITLKEHLEKSLDIISTIPWLSEKSTGCIFLIDDDPEVLVMKTHRRISQELLKTCSHLPMGKCLCGQAAETGEIVFADSIDERHDVEYEGMHNHGHYCVPIKSRGRVLGVINLYVEAGYKRSELEERVFTAIADTLAGIIERKRTEERLEYMANYDILTSLPNRVLFLDRVTQEIKRSKRFSHSLAVLYIDLDQFKCINDTLGHSSGDMLLKATASRIGECIRESDTVARMSGDEFTLMLPNLQERKDAENIAKKIINSLSSPYKIEESSCDITPSIGISLYPSDGEDMDTLLKNADIAMYNAKRTGGNSYLFYTSEMSETMNERRELENDLRHAIENNELLLHYQPQINLLTGKIVGVEALVRWKHPEYGLLYPGKFISIAEESGLIVPLGEWVLRESCKQHVEWSNSGISLLKVALNLSLKQLYTQYNLVEMVAQTLFEEELEARYLELEITESFCMQNIETTLLMLREFKAMGIELAIDDFGTGYSSLSYLKHLPFKKLKIDRSFVSDITRDPDDQTIVKTIIAMAHSMRLKVIAEGVESIEQLELLRELGCDEAQGFLFSKPLPPEECVELLKEELFLYKN